MAGIELSGRVQTDPVLRIPRRRLRPPPDGFRAHRSVRAADGQGRVDIGPSAVVQT